MTREAISFIGHRIREARLHAEMAVRPPAPGRSILFLPSSGPQQSSLLRVYLISRELQKRGWRTLVMPHQLEQKQRQRIKRTFKPDLILCQSSRHPLNDPKYFQNIPYIYDIDDADFLDSRLTETIERTCRGAAGVIAGSRYIRDWCAKHNENVEVIWTGTNITAGDRPLHSARAPIVTWAQSDPLRYTQEFEFVVSVLKVVASKTGPLKFRIYGWKSNKNNEQLQNLEESGISIQKIPPLAYEDFLISLRETAIGLSPIIPESEFSLGKSFGKVLGYLDAQTPAIVSDFADHAIFFREESGVVSNNPDVWVSKICYLLSDPAARQRMANAAFSDLHSRLSISSAADRTEAFFLRSMSNVPPL